MIKIIIAGTCEFDNYELLKEKCDYQFQNLKDIEIVSGRAPGADTLGERYAEEKGYPIAKFPANWTKYGRAAGPIRNEEMAKYADACIVFWDGESRGSASMIKLAKKYNLRLKVIKYVQ